MWNSTRTANFTCSSVGTYQDDDTCMVTDWMLVLHFFGLFVVLLIFVAWRVSPEFLQQCSVVHNGEIGWIDGYDGDHKQSKTNNQDGSPGSNKIIGGSCTKDDRSGDGNDSNNNGDDIGEYRRHRSGKPGSGAGEVKQSRQERPRWKKGSKMPMFDDTD